MKFVRIDETLKKKIPGYCLAVLSFEIKILPSDDKIKEALATLEQSVMSSLTLETLLKETRIHAARSGYKALGKDPSRYRLSTESLLRRLIKEQGLYYVSNAVDIGNLISAKTRRSVAVLDENQIQGDILIRIGKNEPYEGIGRGILNIENLFVFRDKQGAFGTPTSDSTRTMVTETTEQFLMIFPSFAPTFELDKALQLSTHYLEKYADASNIIIETYSNN